jgi:acetyl-CoA carboxylase biotin carboxyl carrier protein
LKPKEIHDLIEILSKSSLTQLEIEQEGFRLRLVKKSVSVPTTVHMVSSTPASADAAPTIPAAVPAATPSAKDQGLHEQTSPFVGTYYQSPSPDSEPFVSIGTHVKQGQVLCIVEAMKLMNEIEADVSGEIVAILAENAQPVEFGEVLFHIRPSS